MNSSKFSVLAYNVDDSLSTRSGLESSQAMISDLDPSIMVLSEACRSDKKGILTESLDMIERRGYSTCYVDEEIEPTRPDTHGLLMAVKYELEPRLKSIPMVGRMAVMGEIVEPTSCIAIQIFGLHGNDLNEEERLKDVLVLIESATDISGKLLLPTIVAGDFNSLHRKSVKSKFLRPIGRVANVFEATPPHVLTGWRRGVSVVQRVGEMAHGGALNQLRLASIYDTAPNNNPTFFDSVKLGPIEKRIGLQLDHIAVSQELIATRHEIIKDRRWLYDGKGQRLSPHFPVYVELESTS